jgi:asparagine synthase (glutamine-hydrolysing)
VCGICGVVQVGGARRAVVEPQTLARMTDAMTHRGPDDRGTLVRPGVAIGVRRLSVVDVAGGHQPFADESGRIWAAQNGEIYNHDDLRRALVADGHAFQSRCDTEVLPHLYERHGAQFVERLRGMFGIVVWDDVRGRAVLARDRLGIKPLYYAHAGDVVVFASELKSLLASGLVGTALDYEAIDAFLTLGFFPGPSTPLAAVRKLMPGHRLVVEDGTVRGERYWAYPFPAPPPRPESLATYGERLREELDHSIRLRLMSDVPLGAMLSGGLDSSLIVASMARQMAEPVKTFSVGFREAGVANELADAREVARLYGTDHHELELSYGDGEVDLAGLVWHLDEPVADLSSLGFLALSELASRHVTVALSGQGADELLGGYRKHRAAAIAAYWQRATGPLGATVAGAVWRRAGDNVHLRRVAETLSARDPASRLLGMSRNTDDDLRRRLVRGPLAALDGRSARRALEARAHGLRDDPLPATLYLDAQLALVDDMLLYFDRTSMAHSLEVRVPFLDHRLVEFCATIPAAYKVRREGRRLVTKSVLKTAARGLVPDRIIDKTKVGFFNASVDGWLEGQIDRSVREYLLDSEPRYAAMIDRDEVERLVAKRDNRGFGGRQFTILSLLMLEIWLSTYLPRATAGRAAETLLPVAS